MFTNWSNTTSLSKMLKIKIIERSGYVLLFIQRKNLTLHACMLFGSLQCLWIWTMEINTLSSCIMISFGDYLILVYESEISISLFNEISIYLSYLVEDS